MIKDDFTYKFDLAILFLGFALYLLNSFVFRGNGDIFLDFYFNDVLAGILVISFSNIIVRLSKYSNLVFQDNAQLSLILIIIASFVWEVIPLKNTAVFDLYDVLCYFFGGFINIFVYWSIKSVLLKVITKQKDKEP